MAISIRYYLFLDDGSLRRIPQRIANELPFGRDAIPEFAGTRQRTAHVVLELQDAKPVRILDARGSYFEFDDEGRVDEHLRNSMADRMDLLVILILEDDAQAPDRGGLLACLRARAGKRINGLVFNNGMMGAKTASLTALSSMANIGFDCQYR